jgi:hypothetical protein
MHKRLEVSFISSSVRRKKEKEIADFEKEHE